MKIKDFEEKFGLQPTKLEEQTRFVNRIENDIFAMIEHNYSGYNGENLLKSVCYELGLNYKNYISMNFGSGLIIQPYSNVTNHRFNNTLKTLIAIYNYFNGDKPMQKFISQKINLAIDHSSPKLGIKWTDGIFYPIGDELLDKELIEVALAMLDSFPSEKKDLKTALENYHAQKLTGVVENCYIAVEGVARNILKNKKTLDNNYIELLKLLQFSSYWDKLFLNYLKYAHEYRRHAGENRHDIKAAEVEAFLYLTCLILRSTIRTYESPK